ncbi:alpha/beta hydrolase family protein [Rhizorhabdus sp. FW153]|uniref:alpha/beta hydrolase family protein n=1 Tax=Rhizorhabdus sp. FW153 TaxID=3400216 RepID=UPI003CE84DA2
MKRTIFPAAALALGLFVIKSAWAEVPPALAVYGDLPGIEAMSISPSGTGIAIAGRVGDERKLVVLGAQREVLAAAPLNDTKLRDIRWAGEDMVMAITSAAEDLDPEYTVAKTEIFGAIIVSTEGKPPQLVFGRNPAIIHAIFGQRGIRRIGGDWLGYFGGIELKSSLNRGRFTFDHGRPALFAVDLKSNSPRRIARAASADHRADWLIDDKGEVAATLDIGHINRRWTIVNATGEAVATGTNPTGDVRLISFNRDGSGVIYASESEADGNTHWYEAPLSGGMIREVFADVSIDRSFVDPTNGRMLGYMANGPEAKPVLFDPAQQEIVAKVYRAFPGVKVRIVEWTPSFSHFLVETSGNGDSGTWYVVDVAQRRAELAGENYPLIRPEAVGAISSVAYRASDGLALDGILTLPPGREAKNLPVVMLPHGGPHARDDAVFDWQAQAFASRGYAVFQPNFRGSTNRDDAFRRAGYGQWGRKMQTDISDGLAELARRGIVDPKRACIVGGSYGGYAALAGVTLQKGLYRCAVAVAPVSDLADMYWTDYRESGRNPMLMSQLKESLGDPSGFAAVSPRRHARDADAPILLIHGKDDVVVPFSQSSAMADALKAAAKPYELVTLPSEDHWLSRATTRKQMLEAAVAFVQKNNPAD